MKRFSRTLWATAVIAAIGTSTSDAATRYWDINDATTGAGGPMADGDWDTTTSNWSSSAAGDVAAMTYADGDDVVFAAGSDAVDSIIAITSPVAPASVTVEDGIVALSGASGAVAIGANPIRVNQGATLSIGNQNVISVGAAGHVLTLDGGTLRNTIVGVGSGFYTSPAANPTQIQLTSNGGTLNVPNGSNDDVNGAYSIMLYGTSTSAAVIGMTPGTTSAKLTKTGGGEFRALNNWTFTSLDVQQGLYRINGTGGGETGFGAPTGTVTTQGGAMENTTNGSALGTSIGLTGASASPATRSFVLGGTGDTMIVLNAGWTINGPISGPGGLMLNGWARNDGGGTANIIGSQTQVLTLGGTNSYAGPTTINFGTLAVTGGAAIPNSSRVNFSTRSDWGGNLGGVVSTLNTAVLRVDANETVGSLAGGNALRGSVNINGAAVALTTGADGTNTTYDGAITGAGSLTKTGIGTFSMNGAKSYAGDTTVLAGTLSTNSASLADAADVFLSTGAILDLNFTGTDIIDSLFIDAGAQAVGIWGAVGSGAQFTSALLTGTGLLQVSTAPIVGVPGDFNDNGVVDAADYVLWRDNVGTANTLPHDNGIGGTIGQAHYDLWRANFGNTAGSGSALGAAAVPEPTTAFLAALGLMAIVCGRKRCS